MQCMAIDDVMGAGSSRAAGQLLWRGTGGTVLVSKRKVE